jgi:hypothetical protein
MIYQDVTEVLIGLHYLISPFWRSKPKNCVILWANLSPGGSEHETARHSLRFFGGGGGSDVVGAAPGVARSGSAAAGGSPPLGSLVREYEVVTMPSATPTRCIPPTPLLPTQVWYRVSGGDALFRQRLRVYQENAGPRPINQLPPESERRQKLQPITPPAGSFCRARRAFLPTI